MDATLQQLLEDVESGSVDLISTDIFDTLVWRVLPYPTDAFHLIGRRLRELRMLSAQVPPELFWRFRQLAEVRARQKQEAQGEGPEINLAAIYREMPDHLFTRYAREEFAEEEVRQEWHLLRPNLDLVPVLERASELGIPVVGVSDTYFTEPQLRFFIDRPELASVKVSKIYASNEYRQNKGTGLYGIVLKDWDVPPRRIAHLGDHPESDVAAPRQHDIRAFHMPRMRLELFQVVQEELRGIERRTGAHVTVLDDKQGDFGFSWLRGRGANSSACRRQPVGLRPFWLYGYEVFGPVLSLFAEWVCHEVKARDGTVVHGIMREGAFLSELIAGAARHHGLELDTKTIWLSRTVCLRASIFDASPEELRPLVARRGPLTIADFCSNLGLDVAQLGDLAKSPERRLDEPDFVDAVLTAIHERPELHNNVLLTSRRLRERLLEYLRTQITDDRLFLVDLGWNLTIQWGVQQLLFWAGDAAEVEGFYLVTSSGAEDRLLNGTRASGFLAHCGFPDRFARRFMRSPEILEQICLTPVGSCVGYDEQLQPMLDTQRIRPLQIVQCEAVREGVREFQRQWHRYRARRRTEQASTAGLVDLCRSILERSVAAPTVDEARAFSMWEHDSNFGSGDVEHLFDERSHLLMHYGDPASVQRLGMGDIYWPAGAAALFNPAMARALAALEEGDLPPEVFGEPAPTGNVQVFWDTGSGFNSDKRVDVPARIAPSGLIMAQTSFAADGAITALRFDLANCPAVIRVDHLWVDLASRDRPEASHVTLRTPAEIGELIPVNCTSPEPGVFVSTGSDPQLVLRLDPSRVGVVHRARLGIYFGTLAIRGGGGHGSQSGVDRFLRNLRMAVGGDG